MTLRAVYLVAPLALGIACRHSGSAKSEGSASTGTTGASGSASASTPGTTSGTTTGAHTIMGRVSQASSDQLVIETMDGKRETLSLQNQPAVTLDGQVARASDLQPGQMVRASYEEKAGQKNAVSIQAGQQTMGSSGSSSGSTVQGSGAAGQAGDTGTSGDRGTYQSPGASGSGSGSTGASGAGQSPSDSSSSSSGK
jgi:hypothetical protein